MLPTLDELAETTTWFKRASSPNAHTRESTPPLMSVYRSKTFSENGFRQVESTMDDRL